MTPLQRAEATRYRVTVGFQGADDALTCAAMARQVRWFRQAFARQLEQIRAESGLTFAVDARKLARIFVDWLRQIEAQKPRDPTARRAYFDFVSALMLRARALALAFAGHIAGWRSASVSMNGLARRPTWKLDNTLKPSDSTAGLSAYSPVAARWRR